MPQSERVGNVTAAGLPFQEAIDFFRGKVPVHSQHWTDVWRTAHSRSFMVAGAASDALLADFQASIRKALEQGTTLAEFRKDFDGIVARHGWVHNGTPGWRAQVIYETNLSTAYAAGRYAQLTEPDTRRLYPFWQYVHSGSSHPRLQHLAWNGLTLRADDGFWDAHYPPNGWHCGCRVRPISEGGLARMGKSDPDEAPPLQTRPWVNPKTGEVHQVPVGIDPGFDYNPGKAWKDGGRDIPADSTTPRGAPAPKPPVIETAFEPLPTADLVQANVTLMEATEAQAATMTRAETEALRTYKGPAGYVINRTLRQRLDDPQSVVLANDLSGALRRMTMPMDVRAWRGMSRAEAASYGRKGQRTKVAAFVSTSLSRDVSEDLAGGGVVAEIRLRRGRRGAMYVHPFPAVQFDQYEVLINAGCTLRVIERDGDTLVLELADGDGGN